MSDTKQLEAVLTAVSQRTGGHSDAEKSEIPVRVCDLKRALAALSPAPNECSGFVCAYHTENPGFKTICNAWWHKCECGSMLRDHAHQQEQAQQPAPDTGIARNIPECGHYDCAPTALPELVTVVWTSAGKLCRLSDAQAYQRECERLREELAKHAAHVCTDNTPVIAALQAELAALKAQHEAALAQARAEERERCAKTVNGNCSNGCARHIRALGGEGE